MEEVSALFRVTERERKNAEQEVAISEQGKKPRQKNTDYLIGHYAWLYRYVRSEDKTKAIAKIDYITLFVDSNKPRFILDEQLGKAVEAFEAQDFKTAQQYFVGAAKSLRPYVTG